MTVTRSIDTGPNGVFRLGLISLAVCSVVSGATVARAEGDIALGAYLASECVACHQLSGASAGAIPNIIGWPEESFVSVMESYRSKERDNEVMQAITSQFSDEDVRALAAYFGSLKRATKE